MANSLLLRGDCLITMKTLEANSVDAIVTDGPYGLSFMGKKWDYSVPSKEIWIEALRVLKPGGHLLAFGGTRTYHRLVVNIEDAGFEIRDQVAWLYGQGFPKSMNIYKSAQKSGLVCECEVNSQREEASEQSTESCLSSVQDADLSQAVSSGATEEASLQSGLPKQNLRSPSKSSEPKQGPQDGKESGLEGWDNLQTEQGQLHRAKVCPLSEVASSDGKKRRLHNGASTSDGSTLEQNLATCGSGAPQGPQHEKQSNRQSRIISQQRSTQACGSCGKTKVSQGLGTALKPSLEPICVARKPISEKTVAANVIKWGCGGLNIDESRIETLDNLNGGTYSKNASETKLTQVPKNGIGKDFVQPQGRWPANIIFDEDAAISLGEPSRFFYVAKASKRERNQGLEGMPTKEKKTLGDYTSPSEGRTASKSGAPSQNFHPTVKPIKLMEYLIKLVTPIGGTVLDPFMGSGSTGVAAKKLGFNFIGCELNPEYAEIAEKRIEAAV